MEEKQETDAEGIESLSTPLNALLGLRKAVQAGDNEKAGQFLDRRFLPEEMEQFSSEQLINALGYVFRRQNILNLAEIVPRQHHLDTLT